MITFVAAQTTFVAQQIIKVTGQVKQALRSLRTAQNDKQFTITVSRVARTQRDAQSQVKQADASNLLPGLAEGDADIQFSLATIDRNFHSIACAMVVHDA